MEAAIAASTVSFQRRVLRAWRVAAAAENAEAHAERRAFLHLAHCTTTKAFCAWTQVLLVGPCLQRSCFEAVVRFPSGKHAWPS